MTTRTEDGRRRPPTFIATKEHRRFVEFADAVRRNGYIGLCYGPAGVGKTLSARRYAHWDTAEAYLENWDHRDPKINEQLARARTVFYTPTVTPALRQMDSHLDQLMSRVEASAVEHVYRDVTTMTSKHRAPVELLIIDEAERLSPIGLERLRDRFDRRHLGLLLIGMPGIEKRLSRYPQLYSRIGFAHQYRPLHDDELTFVLTRHWKKLGLTLDTSDFTDAQALAAISRTTRGNFRLLQRLFVQIERVMQINDLTVLTDEVVEAARTTLVIGAT